MRKVKPSLAIILVAVVLFLAAGIVASLTQLSQWVEGVGQSTTNYGRFLILVGLGLTAGSVGPVVISHWCHRRQR